MVNVAVVGLGNIAGRAAEGVNFAKGARLYAVCSRDAEKARQVKERYGAQRACTFEDALGDPAVGLVYLCTPNLLHSEQIKRCFENKKSVLCEKPMAFSSDEIRELFRKARENGCFLMEAQKGAFTPLTKKLLELVNGGEIGALRVIRAEFSHRAEYGDDHWVCDPKTGGSSYDIGVYPICFANQFARSPISAVSGAASPQSGADRFMSVNIEYENGIAANAVSSWYYGFDGRRGEAFLGGDKGYIYAPSFWKGDEAVLVRDGIRTKIKISQQSEFAGEIEHACECIEKGLYESPVMGQRAALEIMKALEAVNGRRISR